MIHNQQVFSFTSKTRLANGLGQCRMKPFEVEQQHKILFRLFKHVHTCTAEC